MGEFAEGLEGGFDGLECLPGFVFVGAAHEFGVGVLEGSVGEEEVGVVDGFGDEFDAFLDGGGDGDEAVELVGGEGVSEGGFDVWLCALEEVLGCELSDVACVHFLEAFDVEHGAGEAESVEAEGLDDFLAGHDGGVGVAGPSEECEEVEECFGEEALLCVLSDAGGAVSFGEFALVGAADDGEVDPDGLVPVEGVVEGGVSGSAGEPFFAADDVGDAHVVVVDDAGEVVGGEVVAFEEDVVVEEVVLELDGAAEVVVDGGGAVEGHGEAEDALSVLGLCVGDLLRREVAAASVVAGGLFGLLLLFAEGVEAFG